MQILHLTPNQILRYAGVTIFSSKEEIVLGIEYIAEEFDLGLDEAERHVKTALDMVRWC